MLRRCLALSCLIPALAAAGCQSARSWEHGCPGVYSGVRYYADQASELPFDGRVFFTIDLLPTSLVDTLALPITAFAEPRKPRGGWPVGCRWAAGR